MTDITQADREAFEAWMRSRPGLADLSPEYMNELSGRYDSPYTRLMWEGWQAALAHARSGDLARMDWLEQFYTDSARKPEAWRQFMTNVAERGFRDAIDAAAPGSTAVLPAASVGDVAHSKSEYKRRMAMGDPSVLPPVSAITSSAETLQRGEESAGGVKEVVAVRARTNYPQGPGKWRYFDGDKFHATGFDEEVQFLTIADIDGVPSSSNDQQESA